jgi:anti-sigma factor RsiW
MQLKRSVHDAGLRYKPGPAFRARIQQSIHKKQRRTLSWSWAPTAAMLVVLVAGVVLWTNHFREHMRERHLISELIDQHVATLASANPVDVVSSDKHTVKPWFEGKIPFTFDLPELQGTGFTLVGGRISYVDQAAAAELIFRLRQHQLSVFIFRSSERSGPCNNANASAFSFNVRSWERDGLCYFAAGDVGASDLNQLASLMNAPNI